MSDESTRADNYLDLMREAVRRIREYTEGFDQARFEQDIRTQDAVVRNLAIVGRVVQDIQEHSPAIVTAHPRVPWALALGVAAPAMRGHGDTDIRRVWQTIEAALPQLELELGASATGVGSASSGDASPAQEEIVRAEEGKIERVPVPALGTVVAHIHDVGDVEVPFAEWIGLRGSGRWIEGLTIVAESGISNDDVEYRVIGDFGAPSEWVRGGVFCGTRGMSLPIRGVAVRLRGAAARAYECTCSAAFTDNSERAGVADGEDCVSDSLAPMEALCIALRPRAQSPQGEIGSERDLDPKELMLQFESLGDNCEFGLVQRHFGAEPLGLLRFAGFRIPIEVRLPALVKALEARFVGLGQPGTVEVYIDGPNEEYIVRESRYDLTYHTFLTTKDYGVGQMLRMEEGRLTLLRRKLEDDLADPRKIFVWKSNPGNSLEEIKNLYRLLRSCGEHALLWVCVAPSDEAVGAVEVVDGHLLRGYVRRFASYDSAPDFDPPPWLAVCRNALYAARRNGWVPHRQA